MLNFSSCIFFSSRKKWFYLFHKFELLLSAKHCAKYWGSKDKRSNNKQTKTQ